MSRERDRQRDKTSIKSSKNHDYLIKLYGISSSSNKDDIRKFLYPCRIVTIHLFNNNENTSGECLVDLESENDVKDALNKTNLAMGNKYIEISRATNYEYNFFIKYKGTIVWRDPVIRMNGLPYTCTMADVQHFFKDIDIARNGIYITRDMSDKALGGGYVAFINMDNAYKAIDIYNQKKIQHRYIDLTPSVYDDAKKTITNDAYLNGKRFAGESEDEDDKPTTTTITAAAVTTTATNTNNNNNNNNNNNGRDKRSRSKSERRSRSTSRDRRHQPIKRRHSASKSPRSRPQSRYTNPRNRPNNRRRSRSRSPVRRSPLGPNRNGEYLIKMRGMPFTVVEDDIREFFPSSCQPVHIEILQNRRTNRPNGDGYAYFKTTDDIHEAMKCDRKFMGNRYVELYFDSPRPSSSTQHHRSKSNDSLPRPSRSLSKPRTNNRSRSRSESEH